MIMYRVQGSILRYYLMSPRDFTSHISVRSVKSGSHFLCDMTVVNPFGNIHSIVFINKLVTFFNKGI